MFRLVIASIWVLADYKWADWRNWKKYYPTILFMSLSNLIYIILTYNHPLWELIDPIFKVTFTILLMTIIIWPASVLLYLTRFPKNDDFKKVIYVLKWITLFILIEWILLQFNQYRYSNGWNIWCSLAFNTVMFPLLKIHYEKPQLAWLFAFILGASIIYFFKVPLK
jgi:hypothetical protein